MYSNSPDVDSLLHTLPSIVFPCILLVCKTLSPYRLGRFDLPVVLYVDCTLEASLLYLITVACSLPRSLPSHWSIHLRCCTHPGARRPDVDDRTRAALTAVLLDSITPMFVKVLHNQGPRRRLYRFSDGGISAIWRRDPPRSSNRQLREDAAGSIEAPQPQITQGTRDRQEVVSLLDF